MRCLIKRVLLYLFLSICVEVFIFNHKALFSFNSDEITVSSYQVGDGLEKIEDRRYFVQGKDNVFIELSNVNEKIKFAYFDIKCFDSQNRMIPTKIGISLKDEGHSKYYSLPQISSYGTVEKSKYVRVHGYGKVDSIFLNLSDSGATYIEIGQISLNTVVPFEFSTKRVLLFMTLFFILWMIRPTSQLYNYHFNEVKHKKSWVLAVLVVNIMALFILVRLNTAFIEPQWEHHSQYAQLAVALSEGRTNIDVDFDDIDTLNALDNPYDYTQRDGIDKIQNVWDTAYYKGNFYVYFGIVPVLVFYLPFFLITGGAFPTWAAVFLVGVWCLVATFCFIDRIIKRWYPKTPFLIYILLSVLVGNGIGTVTVMLRPDYYSLPIIMAISFTISGLTLWLMAVDMWEKELRFDKTNHKSPIGKLLFCGSLFMALVAGCRPQFLVGSFFVFPIFGQVIRDKQFFDKKNILRVIAGSIPYLLVAFGLMSYNYARFGSVFDFGANYNLTTNDMTLRGFELGRIPDGLFQYLFQFPNIGLRFPYIERVDLLSNYVGQTITEGMYGGVFFTHIFLLVILMIRSVKKQLKNKRIWILASMSYFLAVVIVVADTQMAGLLSRYYYDFLWLLYISSVLVFLQFLEYKNIQIKRKVILLLLIALVCEGFISFCIGIQQGEFSTWCPEIFYKLKAIFDIF